MADPAAPSSLRVFGKSLFVLAGGWLTSVAWLWVASVNQSLYRFGFWPDYYGAGMLAAGVVPALLLAGLAMAMRRATGCGGARAERVEWRHAFWWSLMPNVLLLLTVWVLIRSTR
jgi:hypothetical protein